MSRAPGHYSSRRVSPRWVAAFPPSFHQLTFFFFTGFSRRACSFPTDRLSKVRVYRCRSIDFQRRSLLPLNLVDFERFFAVIHNIGLAIKWLRILSLPPNDKIRDHLVAKPIEQHFIWIIFMFVSAGLNEFLLIESVYRGSYYVNWRRRIGSWSSQLRVVQWTPIVWDKYLSADNFTLMDKIYSIVQV